MRGYGQKIQFPGNLSDEFLYGTRNILPEYGSLALLPGA
jgi:hypothetical protein